MLPLLLPATYLLYLTDQQLEHPRLIASNVLVSGRGEVKIGKNYLLSLEMTSNPV